MREGKEKHDEDRHETCFICDFTKDAFEQHKLEFAKHVKEEHNIWSYCSYIIGLRLKNKDDRNSTDIYIANCLIDKFQRQK
jgi:inositol 1,4,5-triphosphate receptor type 1